MLFGIGAVAVATRQNSEASQPWGLRAFRCASGRLGRRSTHRNAMRLPFTREEFYDPQKAIRRLGLRAALNIYITEVESYYTFDGMPGLPKDWEWRKLYIHDQAGGRCAHCRRAVPPDVDPHHQVTRGEGGDHSLGNLILLCLQCHREQHPEYSNRRSR